MHRLLERQLRRYVGDLRDIPGIWLGFLEVVDRAYCDADEDRKLMERSLELTSQELSERNRELQETATELARSNADLEQFAYVASHDLRAPLRGIGNLASWLEEDVGDRLGDESRRHLELLRNRVKRLQSYIDALLTYSRVGRTVAQVELVDTGQLVGDVFGMVSPGGISLEVVGPLPLLETVKVSLQMVLVNLVGNAIKHHDRSEGHVVISARELDEKFRQLHPGAPEARGPEFYEFAVADDGPGIPPEFHERVFKMFQTLRPRDEVEGTGMGLALVRKIVETYGGTVSLESSEGRGTTFRFTWPREWKGKLRR
jgi:signal transduction histidine kinase